MSDDGEEENGGGNTVPFILKNMRLESTVGVELITITHHGSENYNKKDVQEPTQSE